MKVFLNFACGFHAMSFNHAFIMRNKTPRGGCSGALGEAVTHRDLLKSLREDGQLEKKQKKQEKQPPYSSGSGAKRNRTRGKQMAALSLESGASQCLCCEPRTCMYADV